MRPEYTGALSSTTQNVKALDRQFNLIQWVMDRRRGLILELVLLGLPCLFFNLPLAAQSSSATISGTVVDPSRAKVVGAQIEMKNIETEVVSTTVTNSDGRYDLPALPPGRYTISVTAKGFRRVERAGVTLNVQDVKEFNFAMEIGSANETVTVTGNAEELQISPAVSTVVDREFVSNIPLNGRTLQNLVSLTPGVVATAPAFGDEGQFSVNGQRADSNYYSVDGVSANAAAVSTVNVREMGGTLPGFSVTGTTSNLVSVDAVQEFRIQTSTFAPEYGRTPGAQISIVTRSGTNQLHGTLFEYFRNDVLDAGNWFNGYTNTPALPKPKERQNDFGGVVGGPIFKDKTFFFFSYEGSRLRQPSTLQSLVPDLASRAAAAGTSVQPLVDLFPVPTAAGTPSEVAAGIAPANATVSNPSTLNAYSLRIDHSLKKNWMLFARYNYAPSSGSGQGSGTPGFGDPLNYIGRNQDRTQTGTAGVTTTFGTHVANEFLFNYTRNNIFGSSLLTNFGGAVAPTYAQLIPPSEGVTADPSAVGYELNVIGIGIADFGRVSANIQRQLNFVDNFSVVAGKHALKFGVDYRRLTPLSRPPDYIQLPVFCGVASCPFLPTTYLLSQTALEAVVVSDQSVPVLYNNYSLYAQDTWAVMPRLTLTYGLRWEFNPAPTGQDGVQLRTFVDPYNSNLTLAPAGTPFYQSTHNDLAPRVGVAYNLKQTPGHEMVLRGGWGIFYDLGNGDVADAASAFPYYRLGAQLFQPYPFAPAAVAPIPFSLN
ncbi:MAG: TonB-dependent receptor, partial [Terriglobales bacterium]